MEPLTEEQIEIIAKNQAIISGGIMDMFGSTVTSENMMNLYLEFKRTLRDTETLTNASKSFDEELA
jgi:hypothetical protein